MQHWTNDEGRGSFADMVDYVESVLAENFDPIPEQNVGMHNPYHRRARNIVTSILSQLGVRIAYPEEVMAKKKQSDLTFTNNDRKIGELSDLGDGSVEVKITDPDVKQDMQENPHKYEMMNIQLPETD